MGNIAVISMQSEALRIARLSKYISPDVLTSGLPLVGWTLGQIHALRLRFHKGQHSSFSTIDEFCSIFGLDRPKDDGAFHVFAQVSVSGRFSVGVGETHVATLQQAFLAVVLCSKLSTLDTIEHALRLFNLAPCTRISSAELLTLLHDLLNGLALLTGGTLLSEAVAAGVYDKIFSKLKFEYDATIDAAAVTKLLQHCPHFCRLRSHFHDYSTDDSGLDLFSEHVTEIPIFPCDRHKLPKLSKVDETRTSAPTAVTSPMPPLTPCKPTTRRTAMRRLTKRTMHNEETRIHMICSKHTILELHTTFSRCDADKSNEIDLKEFLSHLPSKLRKYGSDWFRSLDLDHNGRLTFNELLVSMFPSLTAYQVRIINVWVEQEIHQRRLSKAQHSVQATLPPEAVAELREMFDIFDADRDSVLSKADVDATMHEMRNVVTYDDLVHLVARERDNSDIIGQLPLFSSSANGATKTTAAGISFDQFATLFGRV
ncbi:hypothetical protein SDRG_17056 [Saprolegnia diclina VS20]|uniref:EF-hand domain-containing protein n=1 Tax=Saprolegnia diclina (strain VS20) TaxID=1156394 RepID=T0PI73_SAPDV|nr:hypothetical protein SDRG_17056 [Saprolegnia diclina VS20]EQC25064.1 hypothetical protein SDRG_17056 [Saprolegnia diclina VS20]|eukprot:XP_008621513.1 hypothetical protein SDRG_17056 [Saprolegnia diclina VS20]